MSDGLKLIASILENGSTSTLRALTESLLVDAEEKRAYEFSKRHYLRYGSLPTVETVEEETRIRFPDTPEPVDYYLQNVHNRHVYMGAREAFPELREAIQQADIDSIRDAARGIYGLCVPYSSDAQEAITLRDASQQVVDTYLATRNIVGLLGATSGFPYLDRQTDGYQNSDLVVWVARPAVGKTWLLIHQAMSAWLTGKSVLFVSMEMGLYQIAKRCACYLAGINPTLMNTRELSMFATQKLQNAADLLAMSNNFHLFAGNFKKNTDSVDMMVRELAPDVIYIDGMYLMTPASGRSNMGRYETVAYVLDDVKRLALMRDRPVVATTQFGRDAVGKGKKGTLETIGYSDAIGTHSSIIAGIEMGKKVEIPLKDERDGVIVDVGHRSIYPYRVVDILKGREGEAGKWGIHYGFAPTNFHEVPLDIAEDDEDEPQSEGTGHM